MKKNGCCYISAESEDIRWPVIDEDVDYGSIRFDSIEASKLSADLLGISSLSAEVETMLRESYDLR